jgi:hypothetical protein
MTTYARDHYGRSAIPANNNTEGPWCGPDSARMHAELADLRKILGMKEPEEPMHVESYEEVASKSRIRPARNYRDKASDE